MSRLVSRSEAYIEKLRQEGKVESLSPEEREKMKATNENMKEVRRQLRIMLAEAEESAAKVILTD